MLSDDENDYASPIFNKNGNKIGYAFVYKPDIIIILIIKSMII